MRQQLPKSIRLLLIATIVVVGSVCLVDGLADNRVQAQSATPTPTPTYTQTLTATLTVTPRATPSFFLFSTPPPVRTEEPLTSGFRNVPAVFAGIESYHSIQAQLTMTESTTTVATTPLAAVPAVVQIFRCDGFGCETPVGSGVIIHPSGLILTAYHVLLEDPNNLRSDEYSEFVIALTDNPKTAPQPRYRAAVVADKNEQDIALLAIDRDLAGAPIDTLDLPALPFADVDLLFADTLHILGYPLDGGDAINYDPATFRSFDDDGQLIVVDRPLRRGNSGGPALVLQDGRLAIAGLVIRGRSTQGNLEQEGILRAIDQVADLNWETGVGRVTGRNPQIALRVAGDEALLELAIELSTFDLVNARLRLFFYGVDAATGEPWQTPEMRGPLAIWSNIDPAQVIDVQRAQLTIPAADLGPTPERLHFYALVWDRDGRQSLWASEATIPVAVGTPAMRTVTPTASPMATGRPTATDTPTPRPTGTPRPTTTATDRPTPTRTATPTPQFTASSPTATATATDTGTAVSTVQIVDSATVLVRALRIRSGPGTEFTIVGGATEGERYPVTGQALDCQWYRIAHPQLGAVWIAGEDFSGIDGDCGSIPEVDIAAPEVSGNTPQPTVTVTSATTTVETPTATRRPPATSTPTPTVVPTPTEQRCTVTGTFQLIWSQYSARLGCNASDVLTDDVTYQPFARGYMIWMKSTDAIYVLPFGGSWTQHANLWNAGDDFYSCSEAASLGNPQMGFGKVWCTLASVQAALGQPLDDEQTLQNGHRQLFAQGTIFEIAGGGEIVLFNDRSWLEE